MIPKSPCLNCANRHHKCHGSCKRYIFSKIKNRFIKELRIKKLSKVECDKLFNI